MSDRICTVDGCDRKHRARGYCKIHYLRMAQYGSLDLKPRYTECSINGCSTDVRSAHTPLCEMHYGRIRRNGHIEYVGHQRVKEPTYRTMHSRLHNDRGHPSQYPCVDCGRQAYDWSYDHADPDERIADNNCAYSLDVGHYDPRCKPCHHVFDRHHRIKTTADALRGKQRPR